MCDFNTCALHPTRVWQRKEPCDLQVGGVFGDVWRDAGQFEVGAIDHGALTATFLWTHEVLETVATQAAAVVLLTCRGDGTGERSNRKTHKGTR